MSYLKHKPGSIEEIMANQNQKLNDNAYQDMFKKELEKAGRGIGAMSPKEKKDFFNKIDDKYKAKNEEVNEGITEPNGTISQKNKDLLKVNNYITVKGKVYVIDKVSLVSGVYTMKASDKNGKMHTISSKDVDSIEHWKKSLQVAGYNPKNEEVQVIDPKDIEEKKNYKYNSNFFVNDKTDTLKKFNGRRDYNKSTLTDYLAQKTNKKEDDVYFDDTELVYKDKTVLKNAETKTVAQMLQALKNEEVQVIDPKDIEEKKNYKYNSNFFVNDKTDTLKKFNGRRDYNKSTLTDYLAQKTNKKEDDVYFDDTELVYKDKTVLKNAETKTVAQMLQALKNEEVINEIGSFSKIYTKKAMGSHPSKKAENVFYKGLVQSINVGLRGKPPKRDTEIGIIGRDGSRYYAQGIGQAGLKDLGVHSNRQDALKAVFDYSVKSKQINEELHPRDVPHLKKMVKDGASDEDIKKMHPRITDYELEKLKESVIDPKGIKEEDAYENDRYIIKNGKATLDNSNTPDKKNHVYADGHKDAEKKAKAKGIKETHKISFKEAYKKVKENQSTVDDSTQDRANQGDSLDDNSKDPDIKKPKGKADTGSKPTPVDTSPEIEYKN